MCVQIGMISDIYIYNIDIRVCVCACFALGFMCFASDTDARAPVQKPWQPRISPLMTFMYATAVPAFQVAAQAYLRFGLSCPVIHEWEAGILQVVTTNSLHGRWKHFPWAMTVASYSLVDLLHSGKQAKGSQRRERGLEGVANRVVSEACEMIKVATSL